MVKRVPLFASIDQEVTGECYMLILHQNEDITKCKEKTFGNWAHYCHEHFTGWCNGLEAKALAQDPPNTNWRQCVNEFPPTTEKGKPTRWVYSEENGEYDTLNDRDYSKFGSLSEAIYVGNIRRNSNWKDEPFDQYWVYLIRCNDGALYVGQARGDPKDRFEEHDGPQAAKWIKEHGGVCNVVEKLMTVNRTVALELEKAIYLMFRKAGQRISMGSLKDD
jgi:predicted GIY-YIG superfamily endonuclease